MCRYAWHNYRDHFACFRCRKAFKYWQWEHGSNDPPKTGPKLGRVRREVVCPDCARPMADMGLDFKAPPQADRRMWQVLETLYENGFTFANCGCSVGFTPPRKLRDVPTWIEEHRGRSKGESLLKKFAARAG